MTGMYISCPYTSYCSLACDAIELLELPPHLNAPRVSPLHLYLHLTHSPVARKLLAIQVERVTGYRCEAAASGIDAVKILMSIADRGIPTFDAIMIDYAMTHHSTQKEVRHPALPRYIPSPRLSSCLISRNHYIVPSPTAPLTFPPLFDYRTERE